ncbi:membrane-associated tyrosine- and threonine-specific cdc2-inhibitory kinase isoform X2 [Protopterus annectens]|uniref:membrane-associated tyrosine- and threonine-specific cdc2-inhibitory kinase isoform X2 n=1 Tax=Protopterus annectens TaxID=7888 RepID=UPI001CFB5C72|nr:membrane-associated tyrosine- and threonine-specific cdc2-inhibitory kinase isoform X2 [Protopterus annectens]
MPLPTDIMGDSQLSRTPIPAPAFFKEAEQSFSLKKRGRSLCYSLPPRPPVKSSLPVSRLFPNRHQSWSQPRPQSVSFKNCDNSVLQSHLYDESKEDLFFEQCFQKICRLGRGSFGEVYKVRSKEDGKLYAVKRSMEQFRGESDRQRKLEEVRKHERVGRHQNCVQFVRAWEEKRQLYIQTELCEMNLQQYGEDRGSLPVKQVWAFFLDLLKGLKHLHDHHLVHMDIKPANIFISHEGTCKLGDFGLMLELDRGDLADAQEGDPRYMAPELLNGIYTRAADIFSLGMTILEISCNMELPKGGEGWQQLRQGYLPPEFTSDLPPALLEVLKLMLEPDHMKRSTVDMLLTLPVIRRVERWRHTVLAATAGINKLASIYQTPISDSSTCSDWEDDSIGDYEIFDLPPKPKSPVAELLNHTFHGGMADRDNFINSFLHSPERNNVPSMGSTSTPRNISPEFFIGSKKGSAVCGSPNMSWIPQESPCSRKSSSSSPSIHNSSGFIEEDCLCGPRSSLEPKNLLSMFEEASVEK